MSVAVSLVQGTGQTIKGDVFPLVARNCASFSAGSYLKTELLVCFNLRQEGLSMLQAESEIGP